MTKREAAIELVKRSNILWDAQELYDEAAEELDNLLTDKAPFTIKMGEGLYTISPLGNRDFAIERVNLLVEKEEEEEVSRWVN